MADKSHKKLDFAELKAKVTPEVTRRILSSFNLLERFQQETDGSLRGPCPFSCEKVEGRSFKITPDGRAWFQHDKACKCLPISEKTGERVQGGNMLDFIRYKTHKDIHTAAGALSEILDEEDGDSQKPSVVSAPATPAAPETSRNLTFAERGYKPLSLDVEADLVLELGLEPDVMRELGAGYADRVVMKGRLAFPLYNLKGELLAYTGYNPSAVQPWLLNNFNPALDVVRLSPQQKEISTVFIAFDALSAARLLQHDSQAEVFLILSERLSPEQEQQLGQLSMAEERTRFSVYPSRDKGFDPKLAEAVVLCLAKLRHVHLASV